MVTFRLPAFVTFVVVLVSELPAGWRAGSARILGVFPFPSVSHQVVYRALTRELAKRGHELVVITSAPVGDPGIANYTEIDVSFLQGHLHEKFEFTAAKIKKLSYYEIHTTLFAANDLFSEKILAHEAVQNLISTRNTREHFDLIFVEWFFSTATYGFAYRFGAPFIGILSMPLPGVGYDAVGSPDNPSYCPVPFLPFTDKMTFFQRVVNFLSFVQLRYLYYGEAMPRQNEIARRHFGAAMPKLEDLQYNVSMLFVNYNPSFHPPRPVVPAVLPISGLHLLPPQSLPQDIQEFLDAASSGAIYFSLGSIVRSDHLDSQKLQAFLDAFAELEGYRVLWKWESDSLPGKSDNVKIMKWMPQQDILRHPKIKVFITQGGLQSIEEAIHIAVPVIGIPFIADQDHNILRITEKGMGLKIAFTEITKEKILDAVQELVHNNRYRESARRMCALAKDELNTSLERAVWWTEYVLRHKGAAHLRSAAAGMPWHRYLLLDVFCCLLLLPAVLFACTCKALLRDLQGPVNSHIKPPTCAAQPPVTQIRFKKHCSNYAKSRRGKSKC